MSIYIYSATAKIQMRAVYNPITMDASKYVDEMKAAQARGAINWNYKGLPVGPIYEKYKYWVNGNSISMLSDVKASCRGSVEAESVVLATEAVNNLIDSGSVFWNYRGIPLPDITNRTIMDIWINDSNPVPTATSISVSADPATVGVQVGITATVSSTPEADGNVKFMIDDVLVSVLPLNSGEVTLNTTFTEFGYKSIEVTFLGNEDFAQSSDTYELLVNP